MNGYPLTTAYRAFCLHRHLWSKCEWTSLFPASLWCCSAALLPLSPSRQNLPLSCAAPTKCASITSILDLPLTWYTDFNIVLPAEWQAQALEFAILDVNAMTAHLCASRRTTQLVSTSAFAAIAVTFRHHSIYIFCKALGLCAIAVTWWYSRIRTVRLASPMRQRRLSVARPRAILLRHECWW